MKNQVALTQITGPNDEKFIHSIHFNIENSSFAIRHVIKSKIFFSLPAIHNNFIINFIAGDENRVKSNLWLNRSCVVGSIFK